MKKLFKVCAALAAVTTMSVSATVVANAAVKETLVGDNVVTNSGIMNEVDWELKGDTASASYKTHSLGTVLELNDAVWAAGWFAPWDKVSFGDGGTVTMEFDAVETKDFVFTPLYGENFQNRTYAYWFNGYSGLCDGGASANSASLVWYSDEALTAKHPGMGDADTNPTCWFAPFTASEYGSHVKFTYKADGTLGYTVWALNEEGTYSGDGASLWIKNALAAPEQGKEYYVGINYWNGYLYMKNFKITDATGVKTDITFGTTQGWQETGGLSSAGKVYAPTAKIKTISEISATPADGDRLVSAEKIKADGSINKVFTMNGSFTFRDLGKKFGVAFGLDEQTQAISEEGVSYVYFENKTVDNVTATYVNVMNDGVAGETPVSLGKDLTADETAYAFTIEGNNDGSAKMTVAGTTIDLAVNNVEGYVAFVTDGEGTASVGIGNETNLYRYVYRGSKGGAIANNFNTGYINPENFAVSSVAAVMAANAEDAKGIIVEEGKLRFAGSADNSFFTTAEEYSDYILEFVFENTNDADKPALKEGWIHGYSPLSVDLGVKDGGGWGRSVMIMLKDGNVQMQNYKDGLSVVKDSPVSYNFKPEAGQTKATAVKMVVVDNVITVYVQEVTGETLSAENYIQAARFEVPDTYGKIAFATTESGWFDIDNFRVTPVDDPDAEKMAANVAAYVDFAEIADEYRPYSLEAPEVTFADGTATWTEVEGATGYIVNVNGNETEVGADVFTYTVTEAGEYLLTVTAKGNGSYIRDSEQSDAIEFTIGSSESDSTSEEGSGTPDSGSASEEGSAAKKGCMGSVGGLGIFALSALAAAVVLKKKEN